MALACQTDRVADSETLIRETWDALSQGDFDVLAAALAPDARWRAVEDGPWNCENRAAILDVMATQRAAGHGTGTIEEVLDVGERTVVAFRPDHHDPASWPLEDGIRYVVLTLRDGLITEMKGCATRAAALAYAETPTPEG